MQDPQTNAQESEPAYPEALLQQVGHAPTNPGIYQMRNARGRILYVGKARNLRKRLKSYFKKGRPHDPKTMVLLEQVHTIQTTVTHTEKEALILESNLIKRHRPRYNVVLKDDKRYPSLRLNTNHPYPNLNIVRKIQNDGALYFGPYASSLAVKQTLKFIHKTFKLRKCHSKTFMNRSRPCLNYQMGLCLGPCCLEVDQEVYRNIVKEVAAFLNGRTPDLIRRLRKQMEEASRSLEFELAAHIRDKIRALEKTLERQVSVSNDFKDRDAFGLVSNEEVMVVALLRVRNGFLVGSRHFRFFRTVGAPDEQAGLFLRQYYDGANAIPPEILISEPPSDLELLAQYLGEQRGGRVTVVAPQRGVKKRLMDMALENAQTELRESIEAEARQRRLLERLQARLGLRRLPRRIECFDNSNLQGTQPVSGMVVFVDGQPLPSDYRRYKMSPLGQPDDYAHMMEVVRRRYAKKDGDILLPDLLLVDGGRGQLGRTMAVLAELDLADAMDVAGIAKKDPLRGEQHDKIYLAGRANAVNFGRDGDLLLFLQRIRDEAHRWAITFQRGRRGKHALVSALDGIPGVGPRRRTALLKHFGDVASIRSASIETLCAVDGITTSLAETILQRLAKDSGSNETK